MDSFNRDLQNQLEKWLFKGKVLVLIGARQVGKTTLLQQMFQNNKETLWLNADESTIRNRFEELSLNNIKSIIGNYKIVIIDEVQRIANAGLLLKLMVDNFKQTQFIATGSSSLDISENIFEPLTGRQIQFHLYPFSLKELYVGKSDFEIEQELPFHLVYGNYPDVCNNRADAETLIKNLSNLYLYKDVLAWKDIRKPDLLDKILELLAYQIGSEVSINELANTLQVKSETVESYINLLEKSFVVFRLSAYSTNARKEVSKMNKIYFWDNGVRNAVIDSMEDLSLRNDVGQLWENLMISERLKMNSYFHPFIKPYFWRNYNQSQVDYVEILKDQIFGFEMKWNKNKNHKISKAFTNIYPDSKNDIINPRNFNEFCRINEE
jgi:predicted AAA+ superfamily ATPase